MLAGLGVSPTASAVGYVAADPIVTPDPAIYDEVVVEPAPGLPGYTVYRPADLDSSPRRLPVLVWANGACVWNDNGDKEILLRSIAHAGVLVVGIGAVVGTPEWVASQTHLPLSGEDIVAAMDWALGPAKARGGAYAGLIRSRRVGLGGNSCGSRHAIAVASSDARVKTLLIHSGSAGFTGYPASAEEKVGYLRTIRAPIGYIVGGPGDYHNIGANLDWDLAPAKLPMFIANHAATDHVTTSTMYGTPVGNEITEIGVKWLQFTLLGDLAAKEYLLGDTFGRCIDNPLCLWAARGKNLDEFRPGQLLKKSKSVA